MEFSYFDQFGNIEVDLTQYLIQLSSITNPSGTGTDYTFNNIQPIKTTVSNLFTKYDIIFDYKNNVELILRYDIKDNELVEMVSYEIYGTVDFWWLIYLFNDIKVPFKDWPLSQSELIEKTNWLVDNESKYPFQVYYDYLVSVNDEKKQIILPKPDTVKEIVWKFRQAILNG